MSLYFSGCKSFFHSRLVAVKNCGYSVMKAGIDDLKILKALLIAKKIASVRLVKNTNPGVKIASYYK